MIKEIGKVIVEEGEIKVEGFVFDCSDSLNPETEAEIEAMIWALSKLFDTLRLNLEFRLRS